jgi:hypothetical protein
MKSNIHIVSQKANQSLLSAATTYTSNNDGCCEDAVGFRATCVSADVIRRYMRQGFMPQAMNNLGNALRAAGKVDLASLCYVAVCKQVSGILNDDDRILIQNLLHPMDEDLDCVRSALEKGYSRLQVSISHFVNVFMMIAATQLLLHIISVPCCAHYQ